MSFKVGDKVRCVSNGESDEVRVITRINGLKLLEFEDDNYLWNPINFELIKEEKDMNTFDIKDLKTGMKVTVSRPYVSGHSKYIAVLDTPTGSFLVNTEVNSYCSLRDISIYGEIIKVEKSDVSFNLKDCGNPSWTTVWEKPVSLAPEQIKQQELQAKYDAAKKELEELGKALGVTK